MHSGLSGLSFVGLIEDIHNATGKEIDLLDVRHVEKGSPIEREIEKTGIVIYEEQYSNKENDRIRRQDHLLLHDGNI